MKHPETGRKACIAAAMLCSAFFAASASAADGTVTINGTVTATTCVVNSGQANMIVTLPTVSAASLESSGAAGLTPFNITVSGCTNVATGGKMDIYFSPTSFNVNNRLPKTSGSSANVEIELLRSDGTETIKGYLASPGQYTGQGTGTDATAITGNAASKRFYAQYRGNGGPITAGNITSVFTFNVTYY